MRRWHLLSAILVLVALALSAAACGGGEEEASTTPAETDAPGVSGTPPAAPSELPPEFAKCMAERGFEVKSSVDIHSAPPEVLQACFGAVHQDGG
jgi:hypothetical protein